ncbi:hypothetical protein HDU81_009468 [Chytriomyces hyalinus]|nr:hypothetical protein HDU81_009468 [Chytriomyces hyalinus]
MHLLQQLLGDSLQISRSSGGRMSTAAIAATKKHILLYFCASWCPPCQRFTPKLIDFYETYSAATNNTDIEIIFISSDRDEASFDAYHYKMQFLALPYAERDRVASLRERFQVRGIPTLVLLDAATGETLNYNIQPLLNRDPRGLFFPYKEVRSLKTVIDQLELRGSPVDLEKNIALYLDAPSFKPNMWGKCSGGCGDFAARGVRFSCNECKYLNVCQECMKTIAENHDSTHTFTEHAALDLLGDSLALKTALLQKYNSATEQGLPFEVVMVSFAQTEQEHAEHAASVPWPTVAFDERFETAFQLAREFDLEYDETNLVIVDAQRNVINRDAVLVIKVADSTFPFSAPTVSDLKDSVHASNLSIQDTPAVVVFTSPSQAPEIKKTLTTITAKLTTTSTTPLCTEDVCVLPSSSKPDVIFFTETANSNYGGAIKYNAPWDVNAYAPDAPVLVLANFPRREFFVAPPRASLTEEDVLQFIADFKSGKLKELKDAKEKADKLDEGKAAEEGKEDALKSAPPAAQKVTTTTTHKTTSTDPKGVRRTVTKTTTSVEFRPVV